MPLIKEFCKALADAGPLGTGLAQVITRLGLVVGIEGTDGWWHKRPPNSISIDFDAIKGMVRDRSILKSRGMGAKKLRLLEKSLGMVSWSSVAERMALLPSLKSELDGLCDQWAKSSRSAPYADEVRSILSKYRNP